MWIKDHYISNKKVVLSVCILCIGADVTVKLMPTKKEQQEVIYTQPIEYNSEYELDNSFEGISKYLKDKESKYPISIEDRISNNMLTITRDDGVEFYIEHSNIYRCTAVRDTLEEKDPIKLAYIDEYSNGDDFADDIFNFICSYGTSTGSTNVTLYEDDNGEIKLSIEG